MYEVPRCAVSQPNELVGRGVGDLGIKSSGMLDR